MGCKDIIKYICINFSFNKIIINIFSRTRSEKWKMTLAYYQSSGPWLWYPHYFHSLLQNIFFQREESPWILAIFKVCYFKLTLKCILVLKMPGSHTITRLTTILEELEEWVHKLYICVYNEVIRRWVANKPNIKWVMKHFV